MPIMPTLIRLLGAKAPKTDEGTTAGAQAAAVAQAVRLRKLRRVTVVRIILVRSVMLFSPEERPRSITGGFVILSEAKDLA